ncbi:MAG: hypothetical protein KatS3mg118_2027 [Paracoccaceae bacterium]|nr:MAG: hypothetical protein KatS3mg118_2027 [Paracoccaceae bacterium]
MRPDPEDELPEPPRLRLLRRMVTALTGVLIIAVITVVALLVIRLTQTPPPALPQLPSAVTLPAGETAEAVTFGRGWVLVVTRDREGRQRARIYDSATGAPRGEMAFD